MVITRTAFRLSLFGGGSDYPAFFRQHGGAVLGATIDKYCWIMARCPSGFGPRFSLTYAKREGCERLDEIQHPAIRECLRYLEFHDGIEMHHWSDLPARSGVGSSSAFVVGLLNALHALRGGAVEPERLALEAIHIEQKVLKETVGCQDQYLCACGGLNVIEFSDEEIKVRSAMPIDFLDSEQYYRALGLRQKVVAELEKRLLLYWTGLQRTASDVAATYMGDLSGRLGTLRELKGMVRDGEDALIGRRYDDFGRLLHEAWLLKRMLGEAVSNPMIDLIYERAREAGILGGKLLGAGGGGMLLLFAAPERQPGVRAAMTGMGLKEVKFAFEFEGSQVVYEDEA